MKAKEAVKIFEKIIQVKFDPQTAEALSCFKKCVEILKDCGEVDWSYGEYNPSCICCNLHWKQEENKFVHCKECEWDKLFGEEPAR